MWTREALGGHSVGLVFDVGVKREIVQGTSQISSKDALPA